LPRPRCRRHRRSWEEYWKIRDELRLRAAELEKDQREDVKEAMAAAGYDPPGPIVSVWWLLDLADIAMSIDAQST
jgi:hypothetical protein